MATVKVKFCPSSVTGKAGTVYYQLTHRREKQQIASDICLLPDQWETVIRSTATPDDATDSLQKRINNDVICLKRITDRLEKSNEPYSVHDIVRQWQGTCIQASMQAQIDQLHRCKCLGTARNYKSALNSFSRFRQGKDLPFCAITEEVIEEYNAFLIGRGISRSFSLVLHENHAGRLQQSRTRTTGRTKHPFQNVYSGIDRTCKRAVNGKVISKLLHLNLTRSRSLEMARDLFLFSFYTRGMAFVDIARLRKSNIRDGIIRYERRKTGQPLYIRMEPCIKAILDRYAERVQNLPYVFPILKTEEPEAAYKQYTIALNYYNRLLKKLSDMLGLEKGLSSYTPRHSWATVARDSNIPLSVISAGMGHTSEQTTQIYLTMLENSAIDSANQKIIASLANHISS
ncbi:MAG: tyrosine-type recombinase/integrase [Alistipes indistinctus]